MKNTFLIILRVLMIAILLAKVSSWFIDYSENIENLINTAMFSLIGIYFIVMGIVFDKKLLKAIFLICGAILIIFNFIELNGFIEFIKLIALVVPIALGYFSKEVKLTKQKI